MLLCNKPMPVFISWATRTAKPCFCKKLWRSLEKVISSSMISTDVMVGSCKYRVKRNREIVKIEFPIVECHGLVKWQNSYVSSDAAAFFHH